MIKSILLLAVAALLPVVLAIGLFLLGKTKISKWNYWVKQVIIGVLFGGLAIVGTHWGIPVTGAVANARDGAVIVAGLGFGWPAGIISGFIGGMERFIVGAINPAKFGFTKIACSVSTCLAGLVSAFLRKFVFQNKKCGVIPAFFTGLVIEVFHLFMVFVTNSDQYQKGFAVVKACTVPMLVANSLAVMIAILILHLLEDKKEVFKSYDKKSLTNRFANTLATLTVVAFILTSTFVVLFQNRVSTKQTNNLLQNSIEDVESDVTDRVNGRIKDKVYEIKNTYGADEINNPAYTSTHEALVQFAIDMQITEINICDKDGVIQYSNVDESLGYIGYDLGDSEQSAEFENLCPIPEGASEETIANHLDFIIQEFREMGKVNETTKEYEYRKYAGVSTNFGFIQIGYNETDLNKLISKEITDVTANKHVGDNGIVLILDLNKNCVSIGKHIFDQDPEFLLYGLPEIVKNIETNEKGSTTKININGEAYFSQHIYSNGYYLISLYSTSEATLVRNIDIFVNTFLEIIVFGTVFVTIYLLVKKLVLDRIDKTNESLAKITNGNLKEVVDGGYTTEFKELASGINATVTALEGYIDAANKRIDEELAFAKAIQTSVLPNTFPAFPDRKEFDIFASMHTAKEVGGDFYDFYFSNHDMFHFAIADVSGKGIPAALFMMRAKQALKSLTQTNIPINEVFEKGNSNLCEGNEAGMFVTAWEGTVDLRNGNISFVNGGHNPPLIKHANGKFEFLRSTPNMVLAGMDGLPYKYNEFKLEPGDIVYLYTDGVTEAVNEVVEQYGEPRLQEALNSKEFADCRELCEFIYNEVDKFKGTADQFDDITMVAFKYNGPQN